MADLAVIATGQETEAPSVTDRHEERYRRLRTTDGDPARGASVAVWPGTGDGGGVGGMPR